MSDGRVEILRDGKTYQGDYKTENGMLTVSNPMLGSKSTPVGAVVAYPDVLARMLLRQLVMSAREGLSRLFYIS